MAGRGETSGQTGLPFDWFSSDVLNHLQQSRPSTRTARTTNWRNCGEGRGQRRAKVGFQNPSRAQLRAR